MEILDQTSDLNGQVTYRILKLIDPPEFVKAATPEQVRGPLDELMAPSAYADPRIKQFPVHTKAATWMSTAFFLKNKDNINPKIANYIQETLHKMASYHDISDSIKDLESNWNKKLSSTDLELGDDDFALVFKSSQGSVERHYPLRNPKEVKAAAAYINKYRDQLPYEDRHVMANKILDKASSFGVELREEMEFLEKQAGHGGCTAEDAAELLWNRVHAIGRIDRPCPEQIELAKMAQACLEHKRAMSSERLIKLANIVDMVDRVFKIEYSESVPRPEEVLFKLTKNSAQSFLRDHIKTTSGTVYKVADLQTLRVSDIRDLMGDDIAEAVSSGGIMVSPEKAASIVPTLPRPDAELLDKLLLDSGVQPYSKEASTIPRLSKEELLSLASLR